MRLCHQWRRLRPKDHLGRYARWTGSPGTPKSWPTQEAGAGRIPQGEGGPNGPTGFLTLPGKEWSLPGIGPRNFNIVDKVEGTRSRGRQPKKWMDNVKEDIAAQGMNIREAMDNSRNRRIWRSLVEASSSATA